MIFIPRNLIKFSEISHRGFFFDALSDSRIIFDEAALESPNSRDFLITGSRISSFSQFFQNFFLLDEISKLFPTLLF